MSWDVAFRAFGTNSSPDAASRRRKSVGKEEHGHGDVVALAG